ncbi:unnamed protein product [Xylocopa violacea]|uniref:Uncharacterized protein n=1 Tax=Xylocopa violacea TaxID=135666 RepID=A0ABP1MWW2_XYLVO
MSPIFFNSFSILVQYIILKLNVSSHLAVYEKDTRIFVWNCVLQRSSSVVFGSCAHAHIGSSTRGCKGERVLSLLQCRPWRVGGTFFEAAPLLILAYEPPLLMPLASKFLNNKFKIRDFFKTPRNTGQNPAKSGTSNHLNLELFIFIQFRCEFSG